MTLLWKRKVRVHVAGLSIEFLRINFSVSRSSDESQATGTVQIKNLERENSDRIYERGSSISIEAGYPDTVASIFDGSVQRVRQYRDSESWMTDISLGNKLFSKDVAGSVFRGSYAGKVETREIARDIIRSMGLEAGPLDLIPGSAFEENWVWATGRASDALKALLEPYGIRFYEDDGEIRLNKAGIIQTDFVQVLLTPRTGLLGRVVETDEGANVRCRLDPSLRIGGKVKIESETSTGEWKIVSLSHRGDNWDGPFETAMSLRALDDS